MSLVSFIQNRFKDLKNDVGAAKNVVQRDVAAPVVHAAAAAPRIITRDVAAPVVHTVMAVPHVVAPVIHTVGNDASRVYDQVNTLDNGRTFKNRTPTNTRSVLGQVTHNGTTNFAGDLVKPLVQFPLDAGDLAYNKIVAPKFNLPQQHLQDNPVLGKTSKFVGATGTAKQTIGSGLQTALTLGTAGTARAAEAGTADLLPQVVPKVIAKVAPKVVSGGIIGGGYNVAGGISAGHSTKQIITHDLPMGVVMGGAVPVAGEIAHKTVPIVAHAGADAAKTVTSKVTDIATNKPFRAISDGDIAAANRVRMAQAGFADTTKPADAAAYDRVTKKLGTNDPNAVDTAIGARQTYSSRAATRPSMTSLKAQGGGKGTEYHAPGSLPHENFEKEYAGALEHMESGMTGGQMVPDGEGGYVRTTEHTPFYRNVYAETGKAPTKAMWLQEAQRQLQNGNADPYAQAEYETLKSPEHQSLLATEQASTAPGTKGDTFQVPNATTAAPVITDALKRSTPADLPTALKDVLLAKKANLDAQAAKSSAAPTAAAATPGELPPTAATGDVVPSKFPERLAQEERTAPIADDLAQVDSHKQLHNADVLKATGENIAKNEDQALQFAKRGSSTEANATALQLINKYLDNGEFEKAGELTKTVSPRFTRQGQETQILAAYSKLTPTGAVRYAQHEVDKVVSGKGKGKQLENETNKTARMVQKNANDVADQLGNEIKQGKLGSQEPPAGGSGGKGTNSAPSDGKPGDSPEERLAARIKASEGKTGSKPDPVTDMVNTLHKVAKEVLPAEQAKAIPRDPMQLIGQAVKGEEGYHDVYDKAKAIVMDRYKDNPEAQAELEKYFTDDPQRTYAKSQVNAGVQSGLKGVDLSALVKSHYSNVDEVGKDLKTKLIERAGLSEGDATQLSSDIQKRYGELVQQRKDSIIKQIFGEKPTPKQLTAADRIFQYDNLGALSKDELRPMVGEKIGVPSLSTDAIKEISNRAKEIQTMPEGDARNQATAEMMRFIAKQVPSGNAAKALTLWKTGLLTGPQTMTKVILSHGVQNAMEKVKDIPAVAIDKAISTGSILLGKGARRSTALTTRGASQALTGIKAGVKLVAHDKETYGTGGFSDGGPADLRSVTHYGDGKIGKTVQKITGLPEGKFGTGGGLNFYTRTVGNIHAAIPKGFFTAAQANDIFKQAYAAAKTAGVRGKAAQDFVDQYVKEASDNTKGEATLSAQRAVFQQHTKLGELAAKAQAAPGGKVFAPFAHIASAILSDAADYSPIGAGKAVYQAIRESGEAGWTPTVQKHFVEELGRSITGTGAIAVGYELYKHGLLTLNYPTDKKQAALWKQEGKQENSIKIGGKWRQTASLGPVSTVLSAGGYIGEGGQSTIKKGKTASLIADALEGGLTNLTSQSFLSGTTDFAKAVANPQQYATSYVKQQAGSLVPTGVATIAKATDGTQRQTNGVVDTIKGKIPGARESLPAAVSPYGDTMKREGGVATNLLDPTRPTAAQSTQITNEMDRLTKTTGSPPLPLAPSVATGKDTNGVSHTINFTKEQGNDVLKLAGPLIQSQVSATINTPEYKALSDDEKSKAISNINSDALALAKAEELTKIGDGGIKVKLTSDQKQLAFGAPINYATVVANSGISGITLNKSLDTPSRTFLTKYNAMSTEQRTQAANSQNDYEYKLAQAKFNNDVANGSLSTAQKISTQQSLAKDQVGSSFNKNVRDLYGLTNDELSNYLAEQEPGVDKKSLADQIVAYGDALASAGVITKNKFRTSKGVLTLGDSANGTTPSQRSSSSSKAKKMKTVAIPGIKYNPYKSGGPKQQTFKQKALPKMRTAATHKSYKTPALKTNISAKLRKA